MTAHWENIQRPYIRKNIQTPFSDIQEDRDFIINKLFKKINNYKQNLIYYTVFGEDYRKIFEYSLKSIRKFAPEVDVIAITDQPDLDCKVILQDSVADFIESSMKKLDIFELLGNEIFNYNNVLFLDCDILAIKPLEFLQQDLDDKLHVTRSCRTDNKPRLVDFEANYYHGLKIPLTEEQQQNIIDNSYAPFNAGQFMFKPTKQMKDHFDNVRWLSKCWPSEYFYEQGFMNYYFCVANPSVNFSVLNRVTNFYNLNTNIPAEYDGALIHYIGKQLNPEAKLDQMVKDFTSFVLCPT